MRAHERSARAPVARTRESRMRRAANARARAIPTRSSANEFTRRLTARLRSITLSAQASWNEMGYIGLICEALGCMGVFFTMWQLTDLYSDYAFLVADIYSPAFRDHPSFAITATFAIIFDVLSSIVLLHAIRRKLIVGLRIKKALKQGKIKNDDQMLRFENFYLGGQVMAKFAIVLLLVEDIPEGIITMHVIANTYCERERGDRGHETL